MNVGFILVSRFDLPEEIWHCISFSFPAWWSSNSFSGQVTLKGYKYISIYSLIDDSSRLYAIDATHFLFIDVYQSIGLFIEIFFVCKYALHFCKTPLWTQTRYVVFLSAAKHDCRKEKRADYSYTRPFKYRKRSLVIRAEPHKRVGATRSWI